MTTTEMGGLAPSEAMTAPTSRLHAAVNALARWDHETGSGEDIGHTPEVLQDHWQGAQAVWDALQPRYETAAELDALPTGDVIVKHTRGGLMLWKHMMSGSWWPLIMLPLVAREWQSSEHIVAAHGSVRLLWTGR